MTRIGPVTICGQVFDLARGERPKTVKPQPQHMQHPATLGEANEAIAITMGIPVMESFAVLAREGTDIYDRPIAVEADLESEMQVIGNLAVVEALLLLLAQAMQERDAARAALQKGAGVSP